MQSACNRNEFQYYWEADDQIFIKVKISNTNDFALLLDYMLKYFV